MTKAGKDAARNRHSANLFRDKATDDHKGKVLIAKDMGEPKRVTRRLTATEKIREIFVATSPRKSRGPKLVPFVMTNTRRGDRIVERVYSNEIWQDPKE